MKTPKLSIIIPIYNASDTITIIVSQILRQSFKDFELLLINDGSTDGTQEVLEELRQNDGRILIHQQMNGGPSSARNLGISGARGKLIAFFDADDQLADLDTLHIMTQEINRTHSDLVVSGWQTNKFIRGKLHENVKTIAPEKRIITGSSVQIKKQVVRSIGDIGEFYNLWNKVFSAKIIKNNSLRFREDLRFGEDLLFILQYLENCQAVSCIPDVTYVYTANSPISTFRSSSINPEFRVINANALEEYAGKNRGPEVTDLAIWVHSRWLVSYYLLVRSAKVPFSQKLLLMNQAHKIELSHVRSPKYIGYSKFIIHRYTRLIHRNSHIAFVAISIPYYFKNIYSRIRT